MFEKVNITPAGLKVLTYLSRSPNSEFYVREIAKDLDESLGGCHKVLKKLFEMALIEKRKSGRNLYYKIRNDNPSIKFFKIFMNIQELNKIKDQIKDNCRKIVLFGSCAAGTDTMESDIDLLIITDGKKQVQLLLKNQYINSRQLRPIIVNSHELLTFKKKDRAFYNEIDKGIILWRDTSG